MNEKWRNLDYYKNQMQKKFIDRGRDSSKTFSDLSKIPLVIFIGRPIKIRQPKDRFITTMLGLGIIGLYINKMQNQVSIYCIKFKKENIILTAGNNSEGSGLINTGYNNDKLALQEITLIEMFSFYLFARDIVVSRSRNQIHRKYFEI